MTNLRFIFLVLLFKLSVTSSYSQSAAEAWVDQLWREGKTEYALKEYLRLYAIDRNHSSAELPIKIAEIYRSQGKHDISIQYLDVYYNTSIDEAQKHKALLLKIKVLLDKKDYGEALLYVTQLPAKNKQERDTKAFFNGICHMARGQYDRAIQHFSEISYMQPQDSVELVLIMGHMSKIDKRRYGRAAIYSAIIPGSGQAIYGDMEDGARSFLLLAGLGVTFINIMSKLTFADAVVSVGPWYTRYFVGGMSNAIYAEKKYYKQKKANYSTQIIEVIGRAQSQK
jgi:tetratricopeptide (TPR) repeat protein